ncbi:MAG: hypothetical protein V1707_00945, partial [bacterium]
MALLTTTVVSSKVLERITTPLQRSLSKLLTMASNTTRSIMNFGDKINIKPLPIPIKVAIGENVFLVKEVDEIFCTVVQNLALANMFLKGIGQLSIAKKVITVELVFFTEQNDLQNFLLYPKDDKIVLQHEHLRYAIDLKNVKLPNDVIITRTDKGEYPELSIKYQDTTIIIGHIPPNIGIRATFDYSIGGDGWKGNFTSYLTNIVNDINKVLDSIIEQMYWLDFMRTAQRKPVKRTKLKNLIDGRVIEKTYKPGDKIIEADIERNKA